ncbi:MAG: alpha/beta hydrolase family protein [Aureliella sp.]
MCESPLGGELVERRSRRHESWAKGLFLAFKVLVAGWFIYVFAATGKEVHGQEAASKPQETNSSIAEGDVELARDRRLGDLIDLNGYFPFEVPDSREAWERRADFLRDRIRLATGLFLTQPPRGPLNAVLHGKVQRPGFTVEKVYFESIPGHFVTGLLFRPEGVWSEGDPKRPAILSPHGHGGRMYDYGADAMGKLIASGAEKFAASGRFPKLARCAQLARMGCVVFIYDMLGYEDSQQISRQLAHGFAKQRDGFGGESGWGLFSPAAELRLQSIMGVQTWNSIRGLDFLESLPDVDSTRLAVTGGSGGGTQTILLCAIDPRPIAAFPNGMVSTAMQGGCTCENCSLLRVGTGNVELAALFAPKPQAMTAADDWTRNMMTRGYPALRSLYSMLNAPENVYCRPLLEFPHNYNYVSRETMYEWFNKHLGLAQPSWEEIDFEPLTAEEASVWNADHPKPEGGDAYELRLTKQLDEFSKNALERLEPADQDGFEEYQSTVGKAFRLIVGREMPQRVGITRTKLGDFPAGSYALYKDRLDLTEFNEVLNVWTVYPYEWNGKVKIWVDPAGKKALFADRSREDSEYSDETKLHPSVQELLQNGTAVLAADIIGIGPNSVAEEHATDELKEVAFLQRRVENPREAPCYTYGYNDPLFVQRVHDVMTLISFALDPQYGPPEIELHGTGGLGPVTALARVVAGDQVKEATIDTEGFRFDSIDHYLDENMLPGAVKYGGLPAILGLNAPLPLHLEGEQSIPELTIKLYRASGAGAAVRLHAGE